MKAAITTTNGSLRIGDVPEPDTPRSGLVVRVTAVGICGSDLVKLGNVPAGAVLGHEIAGVVEEVGPGTKRFRPGDRITTAHHVPCGRCLYCRRGNESQCELFRATDLDPGGWAEYVAVSRRHLEKVAFRIPPDMPDEIASLTEPLGCCIRAVRRSGARRGDNVVVVGLGPVGILIAALLARKGVETWLLDRIPSRVRKTAAWTGAKPLPTLPEKATAAVMRATEGRGADEVILCAGAPSTIPLALELVRRGGKIHLFSGIKEGATVPVDINSIYKREVRLFSTYSSTPEDLAGAFRLIRRGDIPVKKLISHRLPLSRIRDGVESIRRGRALKVILDPSR